MPTESYSNGQVPLDVGGAQNQQQIPTQSYPTHYQIQTPTYPMPAPYQLPKMWQDNLNKVGEVRNLAQKTNTMASERGEMLKQLRESSEALKQNARIFANQAKEVKERISKESRKLMMVLIGVIGLILVAVLIIGWVTTSRYDPQQFSVKIYADAREAGRVEGIETAKDEINKLKIQLENLSSLMANPKGAVT